MQTFDPPTVAINDPFFMAFPQQPMAREIHHQAALERRAHDGQSAAVDILLSAPNRALRMRFARAFAHAAHSLRSVDGLSNDVLSLVHEANRLIARRPVPPRRRKMAILRMVEYLRQTGVYNFTTLYAFTSEELADPTLRLRLDFKAHNTDAAYPDILALDTNLIPATEKESATPPLPPSADPASPPPTATAKSPGAPGPAVPAPRPASPAKVATLASALLMLCCLMVPPLRDKAAHYTCNTAHELTQVTPDDTSAPDALYETFAYDKVGAMTRHTPQAHPLPACAGHPTAPLSNRLVALKVVPAFAAYGSFATACPPPSPTQEARPVPQSRPQSRSRSARRSRTAARPNVIVFFTDQQRWDTMGLHGNPLDLTPNLDRYARANTFVKNSFTCQPVCGPARSCLQTGLYATATGSWRNSVPLFPRRRDLKTLAHYFTGAGYATGYIGKWHLADEEPVTKPNRGGYDYWLASNVLEMSSDAYDMVMFDNANKPVKLPGYRVDAQTDAMIRYIDRHQQKSSDPFFLFSSFIEPHHQNHIDDYPPPDGYRERYQTHTWVPPDLMALGGSTHQHLAGYYGMVKRLDEAFGRLLDALKSLDLLDNTVILFTADHGSHFKTRNGEYKRSCHESSIHVPTVIGGPGFVGGGEIPELVSLVDLPPTLLDAAGIRVPNLMQGRSIKPLVSRRVADWPAEVFVQISEAECGRAIRTSRWKYCVDTPESAARGDGGADSYTEKFLYDLSNDPYELCNLIGLESHAKVTADLRSRLLKRMLAAGETKPTIQPAPVRQSGQRRVVEPQERKKLTHPRPYRNARDH